MQRFTYWLTAAAVASALAACGSSNSSDSSASADVDDLPAGRYVVALGDQAAPTVGKYYSAADGTRWLVVADKDERAAQLYRRAAGQAWQAVPAAGNAQPVRLLASTPMLTATQTVNVSTIAGSYATQLANGDIARFTVSASGDIIAGASTCKLTGRIGPSALPLALRAQLNASDCGTIPALSDGLLMVDDDYRPARFRLVTDDDRRVLDLWAHQE